MNTGTPISEFGKILLFIIGGIVFVLGGILVSKLLAPNRPNAEKNSSYECGEDPVGNARIQMNMRFYVLALIFLIFEVEVLFLFPWATVLADKSLIETAKDWGYFALAEGVIFTVVLFLGLIYVWAKGDLDWVRPKAKQPEKITGIPAEVYQQFNESQTD